MPTAPSLSASRSQPLGRSGLTLAVTTPKKVTFVADGKTRTVTSTSSTVFGLLAELGVTKSSTTSCPRRCRPPSTRA